MSSGLSLNNDTKDSTEIVIKDNVSSHRFWVNKFTHRNTGLVHLLPSSINRDIEVTERAPSISCLQSTQTNKYMLLFFYWRSSDWYIF